LTPPTRTSPRKLPRQERAKETVDSLLQATSKVLIRDGYDHASTNKIALKAGVSIGSLYQYFPNKQALVAELIDRHCEKMATVCREALRASADASLETAVHETVKAMVAAHSIDPKLHAVIKEQVPRVGKLQKLNELHDLMGELVKEQLLRRSARLRVPDVELAAFLVVEVVDGLIHAAIDPRRKPRDPGRVIAEIADLVLAYLTKPQLAPLSLS
jgi:AcrR family transcriptional regulator